MIVVWDVTQGKAKMEIIDGNKPVQGNTVLLEFVFVRVILNNYHNFFLKRRNLIGWY